MKRNKKIICIITACFILCSAAVTAVILFAGKNDNSLNAYLSVKNEEVVIGVTNTQKWKFVKTDNVWNFTGVYAVADGKDKLVFVGSNGTMAQDGELLPNGAYFSIQPYENAADIGYYLGNYVTAIEVLEDSQDKKVIKLIGKGFSSTLTAQRGSEYVIREISVNIEETANIGEAEVSFVLRTTANDYNEYGYILTWNSDTVQASVPYSFPAIITKFTEKESKNEYTYSNVLDYYNTSEEFKTARRRMHDNGYVEVGIMSSEGSIRADTNYTLIEHILLKDGNGDSYYDMIYGAREEYGQIYDIPLDSLEKINGSMSVSSWLDASYGATYDILDSRGRPLGDDAGTWGPYGYQNGGCEAFGSMDILKGMTRYALAASDEGLYNSCLKYLLQFVQPDDNGLSYIMPLSYYNREYTDNYYFYRAYHSDGKYEPKDPSYTNTSDVLGSFKYYSRVINLGELALITGNEEVKAAFLKLIPFIKGLRGENYEQAVEWTFNGTPTLGYENGGSSGAAAMWANIMYLAYQIETESSAKNQYLELSIGSLKHANSLDFDSSTALRDYPKPESIGYMVKLNVIYYQMTGEQYYLDKALEIYKGIFFYYYVDSNPYTYFQTYGFGYACAGERWEAFMEMIESIVLVSPILEYTDDALLLDLMYTLKNSALWTLPINGYPDGNLGGHSDWLDALFIPFEQPTAVQGDNTSEYGGGSSYLRHSKELYGAGEIFTGALTFESYCDAADGTVTIFNYSTASGINVNNENQKFKIWNVSENTVTTSLIFANFKTGVYKVTVNGTVTGIYSDAQLSGGIDFTAAGRTAYDLSVTKTDGEVNTQGVPASIAISAKSQSSNYTQLSLFCQGTTHYKILVSRYETFEKDYTTVSWVYGNEISFGHEDNSNLYVKVYGYDKSGNIKGESAVYSIKSVNTEIGVLEDFNYALPKSKGGSVGTWTAVSQSGRQISLLTDINSLTDYPAGMEDAAGYMAVYKPPYSGNDVDTFTNNYCVDITEYNLFDFYPYTKNAGSYFSLKIKMGEETVTLIDKVQYFDKYVYRFNLSEYTQKTGTQAIQVIFVSEGCNRGFAVSRFRFVKETENSNDYYLDRVDFVSQYCLNNNSNYLVINNDEDLSACNKTEFALGNIIPSVYTGFDISLKGVTSEIRNKVYANVLIYKSNSLIAPVYSGRVLLDDSGVISVNFADAGITEEANYILNLSFETKLGGQKVNGLVVTCIKFTSNETAAVYNVTALDSNNYILANGWKSNWAFSNSQGYIYNGNPNVGYASIYLDRVTVDLDKIPILKLYVEDVALGAGYVLKVNDRTMGIDIPLTLTQSSAGIFIVDLRDKLGRTGTATLRFDFYIIAQSNVSVGVKFTKLELLKGSVIYDNPSATIYSETESERFTVDLNQTPYVFVDIANLTYGSRWLMYIEDESGIVYELKTMLEKAYGKMYFRGKLGAFKYDLRDILRESGSVRTLKLIIMLDNEGSSISYRSIRLSDTNETPLLRETAYFD